MAPPEVWLRGPVADIPPLLQPVAHSLLQSREEVAAVVPSLSEEQLWLRPGGAASVGFHTRHAAGALDRLFAYARGDTLSSAQRQALLVESSPHGRPEEASHLVSEFAATVERAVAQLRGTTDGALLEQRLVGRAQLPSTVLGLLFHAAEHTQRHVGQIVSMAKVVRGASA